MNKVTGLILCGAIAAWGAEKKIEMKDLPAAVQTAVQAELKGAELVGISKEVEKGKTFYEAETKRAGKSRDLLLDTKGAVVEVEEETELASLPAAARDALMKKTSGGKITKVEALSKGGKLVAFEAAFAKGSKTSETAVTPEGAPYKD